MVVSVPIYTLRFSSLSKGKDGPYHHDTSGQASCSTAPMSTPAIASRKEITFAFPWLTFGPVNARQSIRLFPHRSYTGIEYCR
jgi:hypothetical protein